LLWQVKGRSSGLLNATPAAYEEGLSKPWKIIYKSLFHTLGILICNSCPNIVCMLHHWITHLSQIFHKHSNASDYGKTKALTKQKRSQKRIEFFLGHVVWEMTLKQINRNLEFVRKKILMCKRNN
jgi:uncharacterized membrane protein YagU involved in acid resistance